MEDYQSNQRISRGSCLGSEEASRPPARASRPNKHRRSRLRHDHVNFGSTPSFRSSLGSRTRAHPDARLGEIGRKEIFHGGLAKTFGEKGENKIAPLLLSHHRDPGNISVVLGHERQIAPAGFPFPAVKIVENE